MKNVPKNEPGSLDLYANLYGTEVMSAALRNQESLERAQNLY